MLPHAGLSTLVGWGSVEISWPRIDEGLMWGMQDYVLERSLHSTIVLPQLESRPAAMKSNEVSIDCYVHIPNRPFAQQ